MTYTDIQVQTSDGTNDIFSQAFTVKVISPAEVGVRFYNQTFTHEYITGNEPISATTQGQITGLGVDFIVDSKIYNQSSPPFDKLDIVTDQPQYVEVFPDKFYGFEVYAVQNGTANIKVLAPDDTVLGQKAINVNLASTAQVLSVAVSPVTVTNDGTPISLSASANSPLGITIYGITNGDFATSNWSDDQGIYYYNGSYIPAPGEVPGTYYFEGKVVDGDNTLSRKTPFYIINDETKSELRGNIYNLDATGFMHGASGTMELYDPTGTGLTAAETRHVWSMTSDYVLAYITPGNYKVKFIPDNTALYQSQWYPNASSFEAASTLSLSVGASLPDIHFFILAQESEPEYGIYISPDWLEAGYNHNIIAVNDESNNGLWAIGDTLHFEVIRAVLDPTTANTLLRATPVTFCRIMPLP